MMSLPILNYHGLESSREEYAFTEEEREYVINSREFTVQMDYLKNNDYTALPLEQLKSWLLGQGNAEKPIVLTFDDGLLSHFDYAFGSLKLRSMPALFFISVDLIGHKGYMEWEHVKEISAAGFEIGSHGLTHIALARVTEDQLMKEVTFSKKIIEDRTGKAASSFSVPRGFYHPRIRKAVAAAGYEFMFTSSFDLNRPGQDRFRLNRIAITPATEQPQFEKWVRGDLGAKKYVEKVKTAVRETLPPQVYCGMSAWKRKILGAK